MGRTKEVITTQVTPQQLRDMTALAARDKRARAALIRDAIAEYLHKRRLEIPTGDDAQEQLDYMPMKCARCNSTGCQKCRGKRGIGYKR